MARGRDGLVDFLPRLAALLAERAQLEELGAVVLDQTVSALKARAAFVHLLEDDRTLRLLGQRNLPADLVERLQRVSRDAPLLTARVVRTREMQVVEDVAALDPRLTETRDVLDRTHARSMVVVPLPAFGRLVGVLTYVLARPHRFTSDEVAGIRAVAGVFAVGLAHAAMYERCLQSEASLRRSEESLARAQRMAHLGDWEWDLRSHAVRWSEEVYRLFGFRPREIAPTYEAFLDRVHPDDRNLVRGTIETALVGGGTYQVDHRIVRRDGVERVVHEVVEVARDPTGRPVRLSGTVQDVTERKRAEEAVAESERRFRAIFDGAAIGIALVDMGGRIVASNPALQRMLGYEEQQLRGTPFPDITHPDDVEKDLALFRELAAGRRDHYQIEKRYYRRDGKLIWGRLTVSLVRGARGEPQFAVGMVEDITERKRFEEERERLHEQLEVERRWLRTVFESSPVGIVLVEGVRAARIRANPRMVDLVGRPLGPGEPVERLAEFLLRLDGRPLSRQDVRSLAALTGESVVGVEVVLRRPDGRELFALVNAVPTRDRQGRQIGSVVIFNDVTALKELERLREEWTSVVAHDLRQPLTVIQGALGILRRSLQGAAPRETGNRALEHITSAATTLDRMVRDLLDVSRIEARRLRLERQPVSLPALARAVVERMASALQGHPVRVEVRGDVPLVRADPGRIEQVLVNLLSNAVKYGYPATEIRVEIERRGAVVQVAVTNQGPGIAPEDIPHLFTRFHRTRAAAGEGVPGLGLGLYIARGLVEAHGGRIWVESVPGRTTTFRFTIPIP